MTKEQDKLYIWIRSNMPYSVELINKLNEFFLQNVVIPRGQNRHPYADVYYEYLEDITKELEYKYNNVWLSSSFNREDNTVELRIKPSEPTFEYLWLLMEGDKVIDSTYATNEDMTEDYPMCPWLKVEETKRIRNV